MNTIGLGNEFTPIDQEIVRCWLMLIFVGFDPSNKILFFTGGVYG